MPKPSTGGDAEVGSIDEVIVGARFDGGFDEAMVRVPGFRSSSIERVQSFTIFAELPGQMHPESDISN